MGVQMGLAQLKNDAHDLITCMMQESTLIKDKSSLVNALLSYFILINKWLKSNLKRFSIWYLSNFH